MLCAYVVCTVMQCIRYVCMHCYALLYRHTGAYRMYSVYAVLITGVFILLSYGAAVHNRKNTSAHRI